MAGFLRKKPKNDDKQGKSNTNLPDLSTATNSSSMAVPPLYARFATTSPVKPEATSTPNASRPMVSGPMSLASTRRVGTGSPGSSGSPGYSPYGKSNGNDDRRPYANGSGNGKWNGSGLDLKTSPRQELNAVASGSGYFSKDPYASSYASPSRTQFQPGTNNTKGSPALHERQGSYGSAIPKSTSRLSLDKPLPSPHLVDQFALPPQPTTPKVKDHRLSKSLIPTYPATGPPRNEKPLPVPVPTSLVPEAPPNFASEAKQIRASARQANNLPGVLNDDSPYPDIRPKETKERAAVVNANANVMKNAIGSPSTYTNTVPSQFASSTQSFASRYPQDLTQHISTKQNLPPQPPSNPTTYGNGTAIPGPSASTYPSNQYQYQNYSQPPRDTSPSPTKKSKMLSRISLSRPSHSKLQKHQPDHTPEVSQSSSDGPPLDYQVEPFAMGPIPAPITHSENRLPPGAAMPSSPSTSGHGHELPLPTKDRAGKRISLDNPVELRKSLEQQQQSASKSAYVTSAISQEASSSTPRRRTASQSSSLGSASGSTRKHQPQTSFGDFWLQPKPKRSPSTVQKSPAPASIEPSISVGTTGSSANQSFQSSSVPSTSSIPRAPVRSFGEGRRELPIPPTSGRPLQQQRPIQLPQPPQSQPRSQISAAGSPSAKNPYDSPHPPDPPTIPDEFDEYSSTVQNMAVSTQLPPPPPPQSVQQLQSQDVRRVPASKPGHVAHARQSSAQLRKGPLIFAAAPEPEEPEPAKAQAPPNPAIDVVIPRSSEQRKSTYGMDNSGPGAYPSPPPTDFTSVVDDAFAQTKPRQRPPSTEFERHFYTPPDLARPAQENKPQQRQYQNRASSLPVQQTQPPTRTAYHPHPANESLFGQQSREQLPTTQIDQQAHPKKSNTLLRSHDSPTASPYLNGRERPLPETNSKPHRVLMKSRQNSAPATKPATPPDSPKKGTRRLDPVDLGDQNRRSNIPIVGNSTPRSERTELPRASKDTRSNPPKDVAGLNVGNEQLAASNNLDPLAMRRRRPNMGADVNKGVLPTPGAPPTPVSSSEEHSRERTRRIPGPEAPPLPDTITQQAASSGPYEPVTPRARPRPMTAFSMTAFTLTGFLSDAGLLYSLLGYLTFYDWVMLSSISKQVHSQLEEERDLREEVLERYLETVGYERWTWNTEEPLSLTIQDLNDYMKGVSMPSHQYARTAEQCLVLRKNNPKDKTSYDIMRANAASTRAYTRVVLRLRAQAEAAEAEYISQHIPEVSSNSGPVSAYARTNGNFSPNRGYSSRSSSRAPSPAMSMFSNSHHGHSAAAKHLTGSNHPNVQQRGAVFRSPLFKLRRAPLLRVFVPSPDGDWLSDSSVLECESQLKRAGVLKLLRAGDVVWDVAVGDEGNIGRLIWDGNFLIDLDYSYTPAGDLPQYLHTFAFSPSYFHRVIRTSPASSHQGSNPVVHVNISPWGEEIAANLQLLQDRMRTETPQGSHHNVVRWVHRSSFVIRPPPTPIAGRYGPNRARTPAPRIAIPDTDLFVDPGWYGTVVVEAEGTNEGLADLQERCGTGVFPPRARSVIRNPGNLKPRDGRKVFRLLREKSRPGEIWLRTVGEKERLM